MINITTKRPNSTPSTPSVSNSRSLLCLSTELHVYCNNIKYNS